MLRDLHKEKKLDTTILDNLSFNMNKSLILLSAYNNVYILFKYGIQWLFMITQLHMFTETDMIYHNWSLLYINWWKKQSWFTGL